MISLWVVVIALPFKYMNFKELAARVVDAEVVVDVEAAAAAAENSR